MSGRVSELLPQVVSDFIPKVKEYFTENFKEGEATKSVVNILAPGALFVLLKSFPLLRFLIPFLLNFFHILFKTNFSRIGFIFPFMH